MIQVEAGEIIQWWWWWLLLLVFSTTHRTTTTTTIRRIVCMDDFRHADVVVVTVPNLRRHRTVAHSIGSMLYDNSRDGFIFMLLPRHMYYIHTYIHTYDSPSRLY